MTQARFSVTRPTAGHPAVVAVSGDIDLANVDEFKDAMVKACNGSAALLRTIRSPVPK
jgi:anti-anti-sigma regulatory factor